MKTILQLLILSTALAGATASADTDRRLRVIDRGPGESDEVRLYDIVCNSGERTKVDHFILKGEVCYYPVSNRVNRQCVPGNSVDDAAVRACNQ